MANGWTGNILRVNLTTGNITLEDSSKFKSFVGGMGFGYKIMYDEVPPGTKPFDEANKLVFATGPLTGSGAPCSSRVNKDMRNEHDLICSWVFDKDPQIPVFTEGTDKMDRDDMHASLTMFYKEMGWDPQLGSPTRETLQRLGLEDIAADLAAHNLLPV